MREWIFNHFELFLCILLLISRIGDLTTTYLCTPKLTLESNPVMKKLGWRFGLLTLLVCFLPWYSTSMSVMVLVPFFLVTSSNAAKIWVLRAIGEREYGRLALSWAARSKRSTALAAAWASALFLALVGALLLLLCPNPALDWGYWIGLGILLYAAIITLYSTLSILSLFKRAKAAQQAQ